MPTRPGSDAAVRLFKSVDVQKWQLALDMYEKAVELKSQVAPTSTTKGLVQLDQWWRHKLPKLISKQGFLDSKQLCMVMDWKLKRGKFRPLMKLVESNGDSKVRAVTSEAFAVLAKTSATTTTGQESIFLEAVKILSGGLSGVGPATASAVLAASVESEGVLPFMADEAMEGAGFKREYTLKAYSSFVTVLCEKAYLLGSSWSAETVGRALWAEAVSSSLKAEEVPAVSEASPVQESSKPGKGKRGASPGPSKRRKK